MPIDPSKMLEMQQAQNDFMFGRADLKSNLSMLRKKYGLTTDEMDRQHKYGMAALGDQLNGAGLNFSGIRQGAMARGFEDLTQQKAMAGLEQRYQVDSIKRALQKLNKDYQLQQMGQMMEGLS